MFTNNISDTFCNITVGDSSTYSNLPMTSGDTWEFSPVPSLSARMNELEAKLKKLMENPLFRAMLGLEEGIKKEDEIKKVS